MICLRYAGGCGCRGGCNVPCERLLYRGKEDRVGQNMSCVVPPLCLSVSPTPPCRGVHVILANPSGSHVASNEKNVFTYGLGPVGDGMTGTYSTLERIEAPFRQLRSEGMHVSNI